MKRVMGMVVALIGVAILAMGIVFMMQANTGKQTVADEVKPLALSDVNPKYDAVSASYTQSMTAEEPRIQAGQASPSAMYDYLSAQRALLGLAKANVGLSGFVMMSGVIDIVLGLGLILVGGMLSMKQT